MTALRARRVHRGTGGCLGIQTWDRRQWLKNLRTGRDAGGDVGAALSSVATAGTTNFSAVQIDGPLPAFLNSAYGTSSTAISRVPHEPRLKCRHAHRKTGFHLRSRNSNLATKMRCILGLDYEPRYPGSGPDACLVAWFQWFLLRESLWCSGRHMTSLLWTST